MCCTDSLRADFNPGVNGMVTQQLLATDRLQSPLLASAASGWAHSAYLPYGYRVTQAGAPALGFTGQLIEPEMGWYLLGNGHRAFNTNLMRFHSPDRLSPFNEGGINAYAYCGGDPANKIDPSGQINFAIINGVKDLTLGAIAFGTNYVGLSDNTMQRARIQEQNRIAPLSSGIPEAPLPGRGISTAYATGLGLSAFSILATVSSLAGSPAGAYFSNLGSWGGVVISATTWTYKRFIQARRRQPIGILRNLDPAHDQGRHIIQIVNSLRDKKDSPASFQEVGTQTDRIDLAGNQEDVRRSE